MTLNEMSEQQKLEYWAKEYLACQESSWYFITTYCYTLDNEKGVKSLVPKWEYLKRYDKALNSGKNVAVKKSRRILATWYTTAYELWLLEFRDDCPIFNGSRKEELVDDGGENSTPNSIHGKIKFIYDNLTKELKMTLVFSNLKIRCVETGSFCKGESANKDAGRGGGYKFGLLDEAAFLENGEKVFAAFSRACQQKCLLSTSNGKQTMFARVFAMAQKSSEWFAEFFNTLMRPDRDQSYLDRQREELTPTDYAREEEGNDEGSQQGRVWSMFAYESHVGEKLFKTGVLPDLSFDFGFNDPTAVKFIQVVGGVPFVIDELAKDHSTPEQVTWHIIGKLIKMGFLGKDQDPGEVLPYIQAYGDPAGRARLQDGSLSLIEQYGEMFPLNGRGRGVKIQTRNISNVGVGIQEVARRLHKKQFFVDATCVDTIDEMIGYHYKVNERTGEILSGERPAHDGYSHGASAIRYWCENNPMEHESKTQKVIKEKSPNFGFKSGMRRFLRG